MTTTAAANRGFMACCNRVHHRVFNRSVLFHHWFDGVGEGATGTIQRVAKEAGDGKRWRIRWLRWFGGNVGKKICTKKRCEREKKTSAAGLKSSKGLGNRVISKRGFP